MDSDLDVIKFINYLREKNNIKQINIHKISKFIINGKFTSKLKKLNERTCSTSN